MGERKMTTAFDLIIRRKVSNSEIADALASACNLELLDIVVHDSEVYDPIADTVKIYCRTHPVSGEFSMHATVFLRDSQLELDIVQVASHVSNFLRSDCLISDDECEDFCAMLLINNFDPPTKVQIVGDDNSDSDVESYYLVKT